MPETAFQFTQEENFREICTFTDEHSEKFTKPPANAPKVCRAWSQKKGKEVSFSKEDNEHLSSEEDDNLITILPGSDLAEQSERGGGTLSIPSASASADLLQTGTPLSFAKLTWYGTAGRGCMYTLLQVLSPDYTIDGASPLNQTLSNLRKSCEREETQALWAYEGVTYLEITRKGYFTDKTLYRFNTETSPTPVCITTSPPHLVSGPPLREEEE